MQEERRLVWRVLRQWKEIADSGRLPRRDEIESWLQGEDGANCLLIAVGWSVEHSQLVVVGVNLAAAVCATDTLAELFLSRVLRVVSRRRGVMVEGGGTLRGRAILYRAALLPLSENGNTIEHVLGATSHRFLRDHELPTREGFFRTLWI